jgi:CheY-like chemotaxis protein
VHGASRPNTFVLSSIWVSIRNHLSGCVTIVPNMGPPQTTPLRRVLAVDDDPVSLALTGVLLESEGFEVLQAQSGEQALARLAAGAAPDCILADLRMPSLAGSELAQALRRVAPGALLLAMSATPAGRVEGYDGVLQKPLSPQAVRDAFARSGTQSVRGRTGDAADAARVLNLAVFDRLRQAMPATALEEVICTFVSDTQMRIDLMRTADRDTLLRQAHTIKGGASMVGAAQVSSAASAIEADIDESGDRRQKLDELEAYLRRAEVILKGRLKI